MLAADGKASSRTSLSSPLPRCQGGVIHSYPTQAEAIRQVADLYNRTRLTPFVRKLIAWWLK